MKGRAALALAALALFLAGIAVRALIDGDQPAGPAAPTTAERAAAAGGQARADGGAGSEAEGGSADPGAADDLGGHSPAGARAAARVYATAVQGWLYLSDEDLAAEVTEMATVDRAERITAQVLAEVAVARDALAQSPGPVWFVAAPLATKVQTYRAEAAVVDVWVVTVLSAAEVAVPQSAWMVTSMELAWEDDAWRMAAIGDRPGPTPRLDNSDSPWLPEQLDEALAGFARVGSEPQ